MQAHCLPPLAMSSGPLAAGKELAAFGGHHKLGAGVSIGTRCF